MRLQTRRIIVSICTAALLFSPVLAFADEVQDEPVASVAEADQEEVGASSEEGGVVESESASDLGDAAAFDEAAVDNEGVEGEVAGDAERDADAGTEGEADGTDPEARDADVANAADAEDDSLAAQGEEGAAKPAIARRGWNRGEDGAWYWSADGKSAATGWVKVSGRWYYLDPATRAMKENEPFEAGGRTYVASASGACPASSWVRAGGKWYLTDGSCAARSGWAECWVGKRTMVSPHLRAQSDRLGW